MAETEAVPSFSFLSILLILILFIEKSNALSIKLLHWDSPESPLYMGNLTQLEKFQRLVHQSKARTDRLISSTAKATNNGSSSYKIPDPEGITATVYLDHASVMLAQVGIGTFSLGLHKYFFLHVDTASELTWTQCEACKSPPHHCFSDIEPPFPNSRSRSYHPLVCGKQSLCFPNQCVGNLCAYTNAYGDGSSSTGILAYENFHFDRKQSIPLLFGCGTDNVDTVHDPKESRISGTLGLGWGQRSLVAQLPSQSKGKFSYCIPPSINGKVPKMSLRFGDDIRMRAGLRTTPITVNPNDQIYFLNLRGISLNGEKLKIPDRVFARSGINGRVGCVIDSGTAVSRLAKDAYASMREAMVNYFSKFRDLKIIKGIGGLDLCYRQVSKTGTIIYPSLTLHFQGADYVIRPSALFVDFAEIQGFCLVMASADGATRFFSVIGAFQQINQFIIYDIKQKLLSFGPQDCTKDE